jgi:hypothetical protein
MHVKKGITIVVMYTCRSVQTAACLWVSREETALNLNSVNQLIFVMAKFGVLFEVRPEFLNNI